MKKNTLLLLSVFALVSCTNCPPYRGDMIWDFVNPDVTLYVVDDSGNNLLDENFEGNLMTENTYVEFRGVKYYIADDYPYRESETKANKPLPFALRIYKSYANEDIGNLFHFGQFDPTRGYRDAKFTIFWADGSRDEISVSLSVEYGRDEPKVHSRLLINGKDAKNSIYGINTLVKKPLELPL